MTATHCATPVAAQVFVPSIQRDETGCGSVCSAVDLDGVYVIKMSPRGTAQANSGSEKGRGRSDTSRPANGRR